MTEIKDGTYQIKDGKLVDYAAKWAYGYIVATLNHQVSVAGINESEAIAYATERGWKLVGVWNYLDGTYFEPVSHVDSLQDALRIAIEYNQDSIYDLRESKEIWVDDVAVR